VRLHTWLAAGVGCRPEADCSPDAKMSSHSGSGATDLTLPSWPSATATPRAVLVSQTPICWFPEAVYMTESSCIRKRAAFLWSEFGRVTSSPVSDEYHAWP
jgi:hypothetical protein